jgi:hypothetical protein
VAVVERGDRGCGVAMREDDIRRVCHADLLVAVLLDDGQHLGEIVGPDRV